MSLRAVAAGAAAAAAAEEGGRQAELEAQKLTAHASLSWVILNFASPD